MQRNEIHLCSMRQVLTKPNRLRGNITHSYLEHHADTSSGLASGLYSHRVAALPPQPLSVARSVHVARPRLMVTPVKCRQCRLYR